MQAVENLPLCSCTVLSSATSCCLDLYFPKEEALSWAVKFGLATVVSGVRENCSSFSFPIEIGDGTEAKFIFPNWGKS
jgi:hypothetical protein